MNKNTKFYKATEKIVKNYDKYKDMSNSEIAEEFELPSGVVAHIMRTLYIVNGGK